MTIELDQCIANNSHTAEPDDLTSAAAQKRARKARAKQLAAAPTALERDASDPPAGLVDLEVCDLAKVPLSAANDLEGAPLDDWARAHPLPPAGAPLRDWARALHGAGLYPVRGHGITSPAAPCDCADKKTCEHRARCTCGKACTTPGKRPHGTGWQNKDRAFDPAAFVEGDNIGLLMGLQRGGEYLIALDVDDLERMTALVNVLGDPGPTMVGRSARGERRIYRLGDYVSRGKDRLKNITALTLEVERHHPPAGVRPEDLKIPGVDCKVDGGYLVVGPSLHPTGVRYVWNSWREPAELPAEWAQALLAPLPRPKALDKYSPRDFETNRNAQKRHLGWVEGAVIGECRLIAHAAPSTAHHTILTALSRLYPMARGAGGTDEERRYIASEVRRAGLSRHVPERELDALICDQWNWAVREDKRREMPDRPRPGRVRAAPAGELADADAIELEEQQFEDWDGHSPLHLAGEAGSRVRVAGLTYDDQGAPTKTAGNVAVMLANYPGGPPRYDEFHDVVKWPDGRTYDDVRDLVDVENWLLAHPETRVRAKPDAIDKGIAYAASMRAFHPVRDYLHALEWDKTPRVERLFADYFGAMHSAYTAGASRCFMVGAVARIMCPGEQVDTMPVLEGKQGIGKSRALRVLAGEWFSDTTIPDRSPDRYQALRGVFIYEIGELSGMTRSEIEATKNFITSAVDRYRTSYARRAADVPRQVVFAGTTNAHAYLNDSTGARRFHPVTCGLINLEALRRDRDQLWAEAVVMLERGEAWHLSRDLEDDQQRIASEREHQDPWAEVVASWPAKFTRKPMTAHEGLGELGIETGRQTRADEMRLGKLLAQQGWTRCRSLVNGVQAIRWAPPPAE